MLLIHALHPECGSPQGWIMDINKLRQDFPILQERNGRKPVVYMDTACQSLRPHSVIDAICQYYEESSACSGRSMHRLAAEVTRGVDQSRANIARFINAGRKEEIVFTRNTTEGINLVANSLQLKAGDAVLISDKEHNSNLIPWQMLAQKKAIVLKRVPSRADNTFDLEGFEQFLDDQVKLVALGYTSNLDGVTIPAQEIIQKAHRNGALVLLDAAQTAPHKKVNVKSLDVDFLAFSGHKMLGPSGSGVLYGKYHLLEGLDPFLVGGDTVLSSTYDSCEFLPPPEKFEAGLQDYAGIIGLGAAVQYLDRVGFDAIQKQELLLNESITAEIKDMPKLRWIGPTDPKLRGGIVSFYLDGVDSHRVALMLDQMAGILVRSGQHCVHSWFHAHNIKGSVRASLYFYNTLEEAELFAANLKKIGRIL
ncbi:MAG: aminotransferase class V-fold PLP-dependent enzyme [Anaerolineaceae bacterium]|nr:aminotransferase class V-fold PLP-dependent enzyme [Anaerolineaceae bacterium]